MVSKDRHDGTGQKIKIVTTGRDGIYFFARRDGTVHVVFHDGTGRYINSSTTGRDGTFFFSTARAVHFCFHDGTGRYAYFFTAAQESAMKNTLLSAPRQQQCYQLNLYHTSHISSYDIIHYQWGICNLYI